MFVGAKIQNYWSHGIVNKRIAVMFAAGEHYSINAICLFNLTRCLVGVWRLLWQPRKFFRR